MKITDRSTSPRLPPPTREQVAALAYAIWQDRGRPAGSDLDIWLQAERMLQQGERPTPLAADDIPADPSNPGRDPAVDGAAVEEALDRVTSPRQPRSPTAL